MHEYSIVSALYDRIADEAGRRQATAVRAVRVRIGELSGVEVELLRTAYDTFRPGTLCAEAPLEVDTVPALWSCPSCGGTPARGAALICPACGEPVRLVQGDEIVLERLELEVP
ncbi:MAG: hydrogenase maturation nickel metallochaperone HypA [Vicinamibacterales bacterium]